MLLICGVGELSRVPWTARRSNQSIITGIEPEYSLEGLIQKLQHFGYLIWRADSLEKTLMLGKIEGTRRRGWHRMRCLDGVTDLMDMSLSNLQGVSDRQGSLACCNPWGHKELDTTERLNWMSPLVTINLFLCQSALYIDSFVFSFKFHIQ